jgi:hypothetical protein
VGTTNGASNIAASNPLEMKLDGGSHNLSGKRVIYKDITNVVQPTATASLEGLAGLIQGNFGQTAKQAAELSASGRATVEVSVISDKCPVKAAQNNNECR